MDVMPEATRRFLSALAPDHDDVQESMADHAADLGFPTIGPEAGGVLRLLARVTDARQVFEFGSGFGYSASWFFRGMGPDGRVVLTEVDADELAQAREFLSRAGVADRAVFEHGDALDVVERYEGPFDVVLVDHQKHRYDEAFEAIRERVRPGGVVVADNVTSGPVDFAALVAWADGGSRPDDSQTRGIADYLSLVRAAPDYETAILPVGSGLAVSVRVE